MLVLIEVETGLMIQIKVGCLLVSQTHSKIGEFKYFLVPTTDFQTVNQQSTGRPTRTIHSVL